MMTLTEARSVILDKAKAFKAIDASRIMYADSPKFNVPASGIWLRIDVMTGGSVIAAIGDKPLTRRLGILQLSCMARPFTGNIELTKLVDDVLAHFEYFSYKDLELLNAEIINADDQDWTKRIIRIPFRVN